MYVTKYEYVCMTKGSRFHSVAFSRFTNITRGLWNLGLMLLLNPVQKLQEDQQV